MKTDERGVLGHSHVCTKKKRNKSGERWKRGNLSTEICSLLSERAVDQACVGWWLSVSKTGFIRKVTLLTP